MTETTIDQAGGVSAAGVVEEEVAGQLVQRARAEGLTLTGPDGLLGRLTKMVLETALDAEMAEHRGDEPHERAGVSNTRRGTRAKTVRTEVSTQTISTIIDRVLEGMTEWANRPLDAVYPVIFIDGVNVQIRDGQVTNRPIYAALAVTIDGERDILGWWAGGEGAKYWLRALTEIKNRGVGDVLIVVGDGLKGLPDALGEGWAPRYHPDLPHPPAGKQLPLGQQEGWAAIAKDLKPIYTAPTEAAALDRCADFSAAGETRYPAIIRLGETAGAEFVPFLAFDPQIRTVICPTNATESLHARFRRAVKARGHFPTEQAALTCLYLTIVSLDPTGRGRQRWTNRGKKALNAFITFDGRLPAGRK